MSELFINFMRSKDLEPTARDVEHFAFMAHVHMRDELEKLQADNEALKAQLEEANQEIASLH